MKKFKIFSLGLIFWMIVQLDLMAQISMDRSLLSNAGGSVTTSEYQLDYSLGEFKVGYYDMGSFQIHEGFHQGDINDVSTTSTHLSFEDLGVNIFPNPVGNYLNIEAVNSDLQSLEIRDNLGRPVLMVDLHGDEKISISHLPPGLYHAKVQTGGHLVGAVSKFVKL